jgi:hypothetical protein
LDRTRGGRVLLTAARIADETMMCAGLDAELDEDVGEPVRPDGGRAIAAQDEPGRDTSGRRCRTDPPRLDMIDRVADGEGVRA